MLPRIAGLRLAEAVELLLEHGVKVSDIERADVPPGFRPRLDVAGFDSEFVATAWLLPDGTAKLRVVSVPSAPIYDSTPSPTADA